MQLGFIAIRALFAYVFLLLLIRLKGKHAVAEATAFDFVLALILGDMIDDLFWGDVPASQFVVATGTLVAADAIVTLWTYASVRAYYVFNGRPAVFLRNGKPQQKAMQRELASEEDLEHLLRARGIERERWDEVHIGAAELDGQLSVVPTRAAKPAQKKDWP